MFEPSDAFIFIILIIILLFHEIQSLCQKHQLHLSEQWLTVGGMSSDMCNRKRHSCARAVVSGASCTREHRFVKASATHFLLLLHLSFDTTNNLLKIFTIIPLKSKKQMLSEAVSAFTLSSMTSRNPSLLLAGKKKHEWVQRHRPVSALNEPYYPFRKKEKVCTQTAEISLRLSFYSVCQRRVNGRKASAVNEKLHLSESAAQCLEYVVCWTSCLLRESFHRYGFIRMRHTHVPM